MLTMCFGLTTLVLGVPALAVDQIIRLPECEALTPAQLHEWAETALLKREYTIEENTPTRLTAEQDKLRVEILIEPLQMTIRWKEGFAGSRDYWLRNLKTDVLWRLAE
jgi:hypothetical protein